MLGRCMRKRAEHAFGRTPECVAASTKPTRRRPVSPFAARCAVRCARSACDNVSRASGRKALPAGVRSTPRDVRSNSGVPISPFEVANLTAQRGLRDVQARRGAPKVELFRDSDEVS